MSPSEPKPKGLFGEYKDLGRSAYAELRESSIRRDARRDFKDLYEFYVDEQTRERLDRMGLLRRWLWQAAWLIRNLIGRLSPFRRLLVVAALVLLVWKLQNDHSHAALLAPLLLLWVIALELKDKLLARDELEVGRAIQLSLLPDDVPQIAGYRIWLYTRPANDVGGDLVDYIRLSPDRVGVILGDVSGKGLGAALLMAKLQATLRALASASLSLAELGRQVNRIMCRDGIEGRFATMVYLELESDDPNVRILNAGHPPPIIIRASGLEQPAPMALPLGVKPDEQYAEQRVTLQDEDVLVVYSDGVTEAANPAGEFYGEERLKELLLSLRDRAPEEAGAGILRRIEEFVAEERCDDDLSLVLVQKLKG